VDRRRVEFSIAAGIVAFVAYDRGASFTDRSSVFLTGVSVRQNENIAGGERRNRAAMNNYGRDTNSARALRAADCIRDRCG
jgi:hypothetical protein